VIGNASILDEVLVIVRANCTRKKINCQDSFEHDLKIRGDDGDNLIEALADRFGERVLCWPWPDFLNLNEPPTTGIDWLRFLMPKAWRATAFPHLRDYGRLTSCHIAAVIEKGEWFEP
jgi:hypothetical protein